MSSHYIEEKAEDAVAAALIAETGDSEASNLLSGGDLDGVYLFRGLTPAVVNAAAVVVVAESTEQRLVSTGENTGNFNVSLAVSIIEHIQDSTRAEHAARVGVVRDVLISSNFNTLLNAAGITDFTAERWQVVSTDRALEEEMRRSTITAELWCYPS